MLEVGLETGKKNSPMVNRDISGSVDTLVNYGLLAIDDALLSNGFIQEYDTLI